MAETNERKKKKLRFLYSILIAAGLGVLAALAFGLSAAPNVNEACRCLSDGFFVVGVLYGGLGALIAISTTGIFDIISYGFKSLLVLFTALRDPAKHDSFYEYKMKKEEKRGETRWEVLAGGVLCLALAALTLVGYYRL